MRNIEALRNYFLGKDPQLEVVLSDNSLRLSGIEGKHYILRGELIKRLTDLKTAMEEADEALQGSIDDLNLWKDTTPFVLDSDLAAALSNYYTKTQVDNLLSVIPRFSIEVVAQLPTQDISTTTIYLAPSEDPQAANAYDEFIYVNNSWEQIGSTAIDMSDYYTKEEVNAKTFINTLTQDITIPENSELNPLLLSTGWWYTGEHVIYYGESVEPKIHNNALFYFNAEAGDQWFYFLPPNLGDGWNQLGTYLWFDNTDHIWQYSGYGVVTTIDNHSTDMSIPTAGAVYEFVNGSGVIKELTSPVTIWGLEDGVYLLPASCEVRYGGGMYWTGSKALLYVGTENTTTKRYFIFNCVGAQNNIVNGTTTENSGTIKYFSISSDYEILSNKVTSISSSSTNSQYPSAKAVYDNLLLKQEKFGSITSNTSIYSLTEGVYKVSSGVTLQYSNVGSVTIPSNVVAYLLALDVSTTVGFTAKPFTLFVGSVIYVGAASNPTGIGFGAFIKELGTDFTGTDGTTAGASGLVPAPATTDDGKFLCADGTWQSAGGGSNITYGTADLTPRSFPIR